MKEPLKLNILITYLIFIIFLTPWYFSDNVYKYMLFSIPLWVVVSVILTICLTCYTIHVITKNWDIEKFINK